MNAEDMQAIRDFVAGPKPDVLCVVMAKAAIPELLAMVEWLADESLMWELQHDKRNTQLAALTAERDALAAQLAQADDFGADCYEWGLDNKTWRPNFAEWLQWKREKA